MKRCRICAQDLPTEMFQPRRAVCTPCKRAQGSAYSKRPEQREKRRQLAKQQYRRGRDYLNALKDRPCMDCGGRFPPYVMEFDHPDPRTKLINIGHAAGSILTPKRQAELAKCEIVCSNCHKVRTHRLIQSGILRGSWGRPRLPDE